MDSIHLSGFGTVIEGLSDMLESALGPHDMVYGYVSIEHALLILEIARRAPDLPKFFPHGKWATIQSIEERINEQLNNIVWDLEEFSG